jgi:hypothetical protein
MVCINRNMQGCCLKDNENKKEKKKKISGNLIKAIEEVDSVAAAFLHPTKRHSAK